MGYRFPIRAGDRVAIAPHTDLWMRGIRTGRVEWVDRSGPYAASVYFVRGTDGRIRPMSASDLLGAMGATPSTGLSTAMGSAYAPRDPFIGG